MCTREEGKHNLVEMEAQIPVGVLPVVAAAGSVAVVAMPGVAAVWVELAEEVAQQVSA